MYTELEIIDDGQIRLVGGQSYASGRIEIHYHNMWGTMCNDYFTLREANVVCRQLGFLRANSYGNTYGAGVGPIWLDNIYCKGNESSITDCSHLGWRVHNCAHYKDIGVNCHDGKISSSIYVTYFTKSLQNFFI